MKIAIHVSEKVGHTWPPAYWADFIRKCTRKGHEVYVFSGEDNVNLQLKNERVFDCTKLREDEAREEIASCDVFVGPVLHFYKSARESGVRTVGILTSITDAEGVKATIPCAGCIDSIGARPDCHWGDELCQWHVTPNDVAEAVGL